MDLSPKIPPLASLVNGTVMAIAGDSPDQASWALALWQALLMAVVALWGRGLLGKGFGLLCAALLLLAPGLIHPRVDYTLDLPLTATATLALWLLGRWQGKGPQGGRWGALVAAALAMAGALLVKQSALLLLAGPVFLAVGINLGRRQQRWQMVVGAAVVLALLLPWLHHNWITTLGGTNRAVLESAAAEGDPPVWSWVSFTWYLRRLPAQLGLVLVPALPVAAFLGWRGLRNIGQSKAWIGLPEGWGWLGVCILGGWLFTTLSPNKDARYITPVLPLVVILLARAWWEVGWWLRRLGGPSLGWVLLLTGVAGTATQSAQGAAGQIQHSAPAPLAEITGHLRTLVGETPTTLLVVPGNPEINEQTVTTFGRLGGGRIEGRRLGRARHEHPLVLERSRWILLATGDQGTNRPNSRELSHRVRADGRFERVKAWPWSAGRQVELWQRKPGNPPERFDSTFIQLARGMELGPAGLAPVFARIGPEHQLDAQFLYQDRVRQWAEQRLKHQPQDPNALWSLALIATLRNRPTEAAQWYGILQQQTPSNPWPLAYRSVVLLANWQPGRAHGLLSTAPADLRPEPVLQALEDLTGVMSGRLLRLGSLQSSLPRAIAEIKEQLERERKGDKQKTPG